MRSITRQIEVNRPDLQELCIRRSLLHNQVLNHLQLSYSGKVMRMSESALMRLGSTNKEFKSLPSNLCRRTIKSTIQLFKSFCKDQRAYEINPWKFLENPQYPQYKNLLNPVYFTFDDFQFENGFLHFEGDIIRPIGIDAKVKDEVIFKQVGIIPHPGKEFLMTSCFIIELIYEREPLYEKKKIKLKSSI